MPKILNLRELFSRLKKHDPRFKLKAREGKGSERIISHPNITGQKTSFPIKCHGKKTEVKKGYYPRIRSRFRLPRDFFK